MKKLSVICAAMAIVLALTSCSKSKVEINSVADLAGKKIGVQAGTTGEAWVQDNVSGVQLSSFKTGMDAALDLKNRAIDAVVLDELPAKAIVERNPDCDSSIHAGTCSFVQQHQVLCRRTIHHWHRRTNRH